jgi:hypothetical protein
MNNALSALEEFDAQRKINLPHLLYDASDIVGKKRIAYVVLAKKENEILLITPSGFGEVAVIAGLTETNIEYFAKIAPREFKEKLFETITNEIYTKEIWEVAKAMDDDMSANSTANQQRVKNVLQYIYDNQVVFHF